MHVNGVVINANNKVFWSAPEKYFSAKTNGSEKASDTENGGKGGGYTVVIAPRTEEKLVKRLEAFESSKDFTRQNMSLPAMAMTLNTNTKYLSYLLKKYRGVNFPDYINILRVCYVIKNMLLKPDYRKYKIAWIAKDAGFSSHSKFSTTFKNITGISPSELIEKVSK